MSDLAKILSGAVRFAPHGETALRPYEPSFRDNIASTMLGGTPNKSAVDFVGGLMGSTGIGHNNAGVVDFMPYVGPALGLDESIRAKSPKDALLYGLGILPFKGAPAPNFSTYGPTRTIWDKVTAGAANAADHQLIQNQPGVDDSDY
jgi:hypothetical protein